VTIEAKLDRIIALLEARAGLEAHDKVAAEQAAAPPPATKPRKKAEPAAEPAAPTTAPATAIEKAYTADDVRAALVSLQTRKDQATAKTILAKHSPSGTIGGLDKTKYGAVVAECNATV
jgi:hypothetical protein